MNARRVSVLTGLATIIFIFVIAGSAHGALPAPVDLPIGPAGIPVPQGPALPEFVDTVDSSQGPQIAAVSESTGPGETLIVTGVGLQDATLELWAGGDRVSIQPLRSADDRLQAVIPDSIAEQGVIFIWPRRGEHVGRPVRINAATVWWAWPCRAVAGRPGQTVRVFGRNLSTLTTPPKIVLEGPTGEAMVLDLVGANPYTVSAQLPADLSPGSYRLWAHNATGGSLGWSEPLTIEVVAQQSPAPRIAKVDDYMGEGRDTHAAVMQAVNKLTRLGGGTVVFSARRYRLTRPIILPEGVAIALRGVGTGTWDPLGNEVVGRATVLVADAEATGTSAIELRGAGSSVADLTLIFGGRDHRAGIRLAGPDQSVTRSTVVCITPRQTTACIQSDYKGDANQQITDCSLFMFNHGVRITNGTDYVRIADTRMRGSFSIGRGTLADAVINFGGNQMILEGCDIQSVDRLHGKVAVRTCLLYKSSIRHCYMANNRSESVGPHPSVPGIETNVGEQYLFHSRVEGGGVFEVVDADARSLKLSGSGSTDPRYGRDLDWIVFIAKGRGVGQWRVIGDVSAGRVIVDNPWRVTPDESSTAIVLQAFRHNLVVGNFIDAAPTPDQVEPGYKAVGVYLFQASFDNIVADNTFKNLGAGVSIAANPASPSAWNQVRGNTFESMVSGVGDAAFGPVFYCENSRGNWPQSRGGVRHWVGVGNIFRSNTCSDAPAAAVVGWWRFGSQPDREFRPAEDRGLVMSVIENNTFNNVARGVLVGAPANWTLIRNNTVGGLPDGTPAVELDRPLRITEPMVIEPPAIEP